MKKMHFILVCHLLGINDIHEGVVGREMLENSSQRYSLLSCLGTKYKTFKKISQFNL